MIGVITMLLLAREKDREAALRLIGTQVADLGRIGGFNLKDQVGFVARFGDGDVIELVSSSDRLSSKFVDSRT